MNSTEYLHMYSTIHDYQGSDDIQTGMAAPAYIERDLTGTMSGGVAFDLSGNAVVWVSNSTSFDSTIQASVSTRGLSKLVLMLPLHWLPLLANLPLLQVRRAVVSVTNHHLSLTCL